MQRLRTSEGVDWDDRVATLDWAGIEGDLDMLGVARTGRLIDADMCERLAALYDDDSRFRSRIVMGRHGFGQGEYKYLSYPLPDAVSGLRAAIFPRLAAIANRWADALGQDPLFPTTLQGMLDRCHAAGQVRPTPLMLTYGPGDYNCLHQDVYGEHVFPLQLVVLLSPERDFEGGEFVVVEQRPRMQSRAEVVTLRQGEGAIFAVRERPKQGTRGTYRVNLRHGVSRIRSGQRRTLGIIFHDAK